MSFLDKFQNKIYHFIENGVRLPEFTPSKEQYDSIKRDNKISNKEFLLELTRNGYREKILKVIPKDKQDIYVDRLKHELDVIENLGFIDYILMVWDICDFCNKKGIPIGPGRGSCVSSILCYLIGITKIDSIKHGTFFSRFLSKSRAKYKIVDGIKYIDGSLAPDIDQDIDYNRRDEVIEYLNNKYLNKTCKLLTSGTLTSKILIKDVLKICEEFSEDEANEISGLIEKVHGVPQEIEEALSDNPEKANEKFKAWSAKHSESCLIAQKLSGLTRNFGQHASALLISHDNISDLMPLQLSSKKEDGSGEEIINGYDMYSSQELALKFDLLGSKTLTIIDNVCKLVGINPDDIDPESECIYKFLQTSTNFYGIFQFESFAQGEIVKKIKPKNLKQIMDALAISRPGASSFLGQYLDYIHHGIYNKLDPLVDSVLMETGNICLFQEQYLKMLVNIGMTPDEAENARKVLGKKLKEKIPEVKKNIEEVCIKNNHPKNVVDLLLKIAEDSGGYQFSLCLSPDTIVETEFGDKMMYEINIGDKIKAYNIEKDDDHFVTIVNIYKNITELYEVELSDGRKISCSMNHKLMCEDKTMRALEDIIVNNLKILTD